MDTRHAVLDAPATLRLERTLPGPIDRVWAFLTETDKRRNWLAAGCMDLQPGGTVELVFDNSSLTGHDGTPPAKYASHARPSRLHGRITHCDAPRLLGYTWGDGEHASHVLFELDPVGDQVLLRIVHSRLHERGEMLSVAAGWHTHVDILVERLHGRSPDGFWPKHSRLEAEYEPLIPA